MAWRHASAQLVMKATRHGQLSSHQILDISYSQLVGLRGAAADGKSLTFVVFYGQK